MYCIRECTILKQKTNILLCVSLYPSLNIWFSLLSVLTHSLSLDSKLHSHQNSRSVWWSGDLHLGFGAKIGVWVIGVRLWISAGGFFFGWLVIGVVFGWSALGCGVWYLMVWVFFFFFFFFFVLMVDYRLLVVSGVCSAAMVGGGGHVVMVFSVKFVVVE